MNRDQYEREMVVRLFQTSNALQTFLDKLLKQDHLTAKQFFMMIFIGAFEDNPKLGDLADVFGTSHQNVKQVVLKLVKQGFVELYKDPQDSRISRVTLTTKATMYWNARDEQDNQTIKELYEPLSTEHLATIVNGLEVIVSQIGMLSLRDE